MPQYFTKEGLEKLKKELGELKTTEMRRITKLVSEAAAFGDLKENSAYHEARNMKSFLLGRIEQLEAAINEAVIIAKKEGGKIQVGSEIDIELNGKKETYSIVAPGEADVLKNKISYQSPMGKALLNKSQEEEFDFEINGKKLKIKVTKIK